MKLFDKRPLSLILCVMLGGFVVFSYDNLYIRSIVFIIDGLLIILPYLCILSKRHKLIIHIASVALLLAIFLSYIYFDLWFKAYERFDDEVTVDAIVTEVKSSDYNSSTYILETDNINGEPFSKYKLSMNLSDEDSEGILPGTQITFKAKLSGFIYNNNSEASAYNFSHGISARATEASDIKILSQKGQPLSAKIAFMRSYITRHAIMLSNNECGSLLAALLFGERDTLSDDIRLDFKRIGISHILALSGMHLTILSLGLNKLLSTMRVGKNARIVTVIFFTLIYMAFTGFSVSVVRAGIMLIISSLLFLLSRGHDSVTSLVISVFLICLITPYAIYDITLWLSAFATLGVIMFSEYYASFSTPTKRLKKVLRFITSSLGTTLFAVGATALITTITFESFSLVAPVTTLIFSILVEIIMYVGSFMLILGTLVPIKYILIPLASFTIQLADVISSGRFVYITTTSAKTIICIAVFAILIYLFFILDIRKKKLALLILIISYISIYASVASDIYTEINVEDIVYSQDDKYDAIVIKSDGRTALIESSQYSSSLAYNSIDFLTEEQITYLDAYYATHYSWGLEDELEILLANIVIDNIYLPEPRNNAEEEILKKLKVTVAERVDEIILYSTTDVTEIGRFEICPIFSMPYGEGTSTNAFKIKENGITYVYLSSGILDKKYNSFIENEINNASVLIFGSHGKKYKNAVYFSAETDKSIIVLSSDNCFLTQDSLKFYEKNGCEVISHPLNVSIYIEASDIE